MTGEAERVALRIDREVMRVAARGERERDQEAAHGATLYQMKPRATPNMVRESRKGKSRESSIAI
jgi:hypothetical protein